MSLRVTNGEQFSFGTDLRCTRGYRRPSNADIRNRQASKGFMQLALGFCRLYWASGSRARILQSHNFQPGSIRPGDRDGNAGHSRTGSLRAKPIREFFRPPSFVRPSDRAPPSALHPYDRRRQSRSTPSGGTSSPLCSWTSQSSVVFGTHGRHNRYVLNTPTRDPSGDEPYCRKLAPGALANRGRG
jgi:hypothetical protein